MPFYKFNNNDVYVNTLTTYPEIKYFVYNGNAYYNDIPDISGSLTSSIRCTDPGSISLFELNIDRNTGDFGYITEFEDALGNLDPIKSVKNTGLIYQFMVKDATRLSFGSVSSTAFSEGQLGEVFTGSFPYTSRISREYYTATALRTTSPVIAHEEEGMTVTSSGSVSHLQALKNTLNYYTYLSPHYAVSSSLFERDLMASSGDSWSAQVNLISIPTIFYGSKIKPGTIKLDFYVSGALVGRLEDKNQNGVLYQTAPVDSGGSGNVGGVALYNEGFMVLTGAWDLTDGRYTEPTGYGTTDSYPSWVSFAASLSGSSDTNTYASGSSFLIQMSGTTKTQTLTMFATAPKGALNQSNNPTFVSFFTGSFGTGSSQGYMQNSVLSIKNVVSSAYNTPTASFEKTTYVSKIGIYDDNMNLIAIAKPSTPIRKTAERDFTFKIELDI